MSYAWKVQEREAKTHFAQSQIDENEQLDKNGNPYSKFRIFLTPIEPGTSPVERDYSEFHTVWNKIVLPSILKLVQDKKIQQPQRMKELQFVAYRWAEYRSTETNDIQHYLDNNPDKIGIDELGRRFVPFWGVEYLDVFPDEESWVAAHDAENPPVNIADNLPDPAIEAAKTILPTMVETCGTDLATLQERLKHPPLDALDINSPEVRQAVAHYVAMSCGLSVEQQDEKLKEINSHFDEPYMTTESPELVKELGEIAF